MESKKVINFGAGPAKVPEEVMEEVQRELRNHGNSGMSVMEMSHRSVFYEKINADAIKTAKELLNIPDNYKVLMMQGGGQGMFSAICMNLMGQTGSADYLITGLWSNKAAMDAERYGKVNRIGPKKSDLKSVLDPNEWNLDPNASYLYYCDNETIDGLELDFIPDKKAPLVVDMSSNIFTRPLDVRKFGLIFACSQKNVGTAGVTLVIIREDLIGHAMPITPPFLNFSVISEYNSIYNTPPIFSVYVMERVLNWIKCQGGVQRFYEKTLIKSKLLYEIIDGSDGFYYSLVDPKYRSRLNVTFRIGGKDGNEALEAKFVQEAESLEMIQLKGHKAVSGIRVSLYNSISIEETEFVASFMTKFLNENKN